MENEIKNMLNSAVNEIKSLRNVIEKQSIRLEAIDDMLLLAKQKLPDRTQGYGMDVIWEIEKFLKSKEES